MKDYKKFLDKLKNGSKSFSSDILKTFDKLPREKRMVKVYATIDEIPDNYKVIVDEILNNPDELKFGKINNRYYYGDYKQKLFIYKIKYSEDKIKSYLSILINEPYSDNRIRIYDHIYDTLLDKVKNGIDGIDRITRIRNHYDLKKDGSVDYDKNDSIKVGWSTKKSQEKRWDTLLDIGMKDNDSIMDYGCGVGDLYAYMDNKYNGFTYYGVDINKNYIDIANEKHTNGNFKYIYDIDDINVKYDWFIASGVFTVYTTLNDLLKYIEIAYTQCNKGISFNLIKSGHYPNNDDPHEKRRGYDMVNIKKTLKEKYDNVEIVDKYLKRNIEFTVYIRK